MAPKRGGSGLVLRSRVIARRALDTLMAVGRWRRLDFSGLPIVFGNAVPKAGSHLLLQVLQGLREAGHFASVEPEPIRTITQFERRWRPANEILADLQRLKPGRIGWGYVHATPENLAVLADPRRVNYFVYRDPRDLLVSAVFFARDKYPGHELHDYYNQLGDFGACLRVEIAGIDDDGLHLSPVRVRYERYLAFLETSAILPIRFEDLIDHRRETITAMLDYYEAKGFELAVARDQALELILAAIRPEKSSTFRKGRPGDWREHFSAENRRLFKEINGDLLIRLGYESDNDW
jgi:hypothetical protein